MAESPGISSAAAADSAAPAWYVVQCRPGQHFRAQEHLENQGFRCFHPLIKVEKLRAGRRCCRSEPLFPGYLFVELDPQGQNWHSIHSTRGVRRLVAFGNRPVPVPAEVVEELRAGMEAENPENHRPALQPGDRLRIKEGPFADLEAVFQCFKGEERVVVLLDMLQKEHRLNLSVREVTPAT